MMCLSHYLPCRLCLATGHHFFQMKLVQIRRHHRRRQLHRPDCHIRIPRLIFLSGFFCFVSIPVIVVFIGIWRYCWQLFGAVVSVISSLSSLTSYHRRQRLVVVAVSSTSVVVSLLVYTYVGFDASLSLLSSEFWNGFWKCILVYSGSVASPHCFCQFWRLAVVVFVGV